MLKRGEKVVDLFYISSSQIIPSTISCCRNSVTLCNHNHRNNFAVMFQCFHGLSVRNASSFFYVQSQYRIEYVVQYDYHQ